MKFNRTWIAAGLVLMTVVGCKKPVPPEQKVPLAAKVKSFQVDKSEVAPGDAVTLSWEVEDASSISITTQSGTLIPIGDPTKASGSTETKVEANTVFVLTARGEGGSDTAAVSVTVPKDDPSMVFAAVPQEITAGQSATLVWNAPGASQIAIKDGSGQTVFTGNKPAGSLAVSPGVTTTYSIEAGDRTAQVQVHVSAAILHFGASAVAVSPGDPVTLSWKVGGAESVTLSAEGRGDLVTTQAPSEIADGSFSDTVPPTLPANGLVRYTLTARAGVRELTQSLTVWVSVEPVISSFVVPAYAKAGGTYQVSWSTALADRAELWVNGAPVHVATSLAEVASGTFALPTQAVDAVVELRAYNARGGTASKSSKVSPVGDLTVNAPLTATPATAAHGGDPVTLSWNITNARHVKVSVKNSYTVAEFFGIDAEANSVPVYPNKAVEYVLEADNQAGDSIQPLSVLTSVTTPATLVFSPSTAPEGARIQVTGHTVPGGTDMVGLVALNQPGDSFVDIADPANDIHYTGCCTVADLVQLGETFTTNIDGKPASASAVTISINGWLTFGDTGTDQPYVPTNKNPSADLMENSFAPFFADLEYVSGSKIYRRLDTVNGERRLIVQWSNVEIEPATAGTTNLTFQAQIYASGKIVYAYRTMTGVTPTTPVTIGAVGPQKASVFQFDGTPNAGEALRLGGGVTLPATVVASPTPQRVRVNIPPSGWIEVESAPSIIPPGQFSIAEINYNPAAGQEQWFEIQNNTAQAIDLGGWYIDFGGGLTKPIPAGIVLPASGRLVFGQTANSAEVNNGGAPVDFAYGLGFTMPIASGSIGIGVAGGIYTSQAWNSAGTPGVAIQVEAPRTDLLYATGVSGLTCNAVAGYGTNGQKGTPGAPNPRCFPFVMTSIPGNFQSIAATGHPIAGLQSTGDNSIDSVNVDVDFTAAGGHAINIGGVTYGNSTRKITVSSNGFAALATTTTVATGNDTTPSPSAPNGTLAVFWDDLAANAGASGVYWQQFDPDGVANSGDEYTIISWENWKRWSSSQTSSLNFQIRILEATGTVEYHYGAMTSSLASYANGANATEWFETLDGNAALKIGANQAVIQPNTGYRFTYSP